MNAVDFYMAVVDKPRVIKRLLRKYWMFKVLQILLALGFVIVAFTVGRLDENSSANSALHHPVVLLWLGLVASYYLVFPMLAMGSKIEDLRVQLSELGHDPDKQ